MATCSGWSWFCESRRLSAVCRSSDGVSHNPSSLVLLSELDQEMVEEEDCRCVGRLRFGVWRRDNFDEGVCFVAMVAEAAESEVGRSASCSLPLLRSEARIVQGEGAVAFFAWMSSFKRLIMLLGGFISCCSTILSI